MASPDPYCTKCGNYHQMTSAGCPYYPNDDDTIWTPIYAPEHTYIVSAPLKQPFKCPVCNGTGLVSRPPEIAGDVESWTSSTTNTYPCKACAGTGIIWGPND